MNRTQIIRIDVFSDIACPFCYIGDTRLERVLETLFAIRPDLEVEWVWHPFQLQPAIPKRGLPWETFSTQKFGGTQGRRVAFAQVIANGSSEGIAFDFERMPVAPNTLDAHRLVLLASESKLGKPMALALYRAYFTQARDITDPDELQRVALEVGLDSDTVQDLLGSDRLQTEVQTSQLEAQRMGISGVPFFIFDQQFAISGAQPSDVFLQALKRVVSAKSAPST